MRFKQCLNPTPWGACRKCDPCVERRIRSWVLRMKLESMSYDGRSTTYLTLTYDNDHLPSTGIEAKESLQLFFKRLRKSLGVRSIRYVSALEQGSTGTYRYHWHCILYGLSFSLSNEILLRKQWANGFIDWKLAEPGNMAYTLKYAIKGGVFLMSRRPGIGSAAIKSLNDTIRSLSVNELNALLMQKYGLRGFVNKTLGHLKMGKYFYSIDRYFRDRLLQITLEDNVYGEEKV